LFRLGHDRLKGFLVRHPWPLAATIWVAAFLTAAFAFVILTPSKALAYSAPTAPAQLFYVDDTWTTTVTFNGKHVLEAYEYG
jgi:hypothetical protein